MRLPDGWQNVDQRWQALALLPWLSIIAWRFVPGKPFLPFVLQAASR